MPPPVATPAITITAFTSSAANLAAFQQQYGGRRKNSVGVPLDWGDESDWGDDSNWGDESNWGDDDWDELSEIDEGSSDDADDSADGNEAAEEDAVAVAYAGLTEFEKRQRRCASRRV